MIFAGPFSPNIIADAFVASENVGDGGPLAAVGVPCFGMLVVMASERSERGFGMSQALKLVASNVLRRCGG